jgi:hypothetical protein
MSSPDTLPLVVGVAAPCAVALAGWLANDRWADGPPTKPRSKRWRAAVAVLIMTVAVAGTITTPFIAVFWIIVVLNFVAGRRENIPFSTYAMFSMPNTRVWSLRFEDAKGDIVNIGKIGLAPHIVRKRFATEMRAARAKGIQHPGGAQRSAAEVLATLVEQHRPPGGPLAACPITIVLVEYILESGRLRRIRTPILETSPR